MAEIRERVRVVFFDLDETLLDDDHCMRKAVARTCATLGKRYPQIKPKILESTYLRVSSELWTSYGSVPRTYSTGDSGGIDIRLEVWSQALTVYGLPNQDLAIEAVDLYSQERRAGYCLFPDVHEVLQALRQRYILGLISNGPVDTQREKVHVTGLGAYLHILMISGELGVGKPDSGIFLKALESAQVIPEEAIHIGDSLTSDVAGAKGVGMYAIWLNRKKVPKPKDAPSLDLEIHTLWDLVPLLSPLPFHNNNV